MDDQVKTLDSIDSSSVQILVGECPPLALHTPYTYWFMLSRDPKLCQGLFDGDRLVGAVLAVPISADEAFVWQIGVRPEARGRGLGANLLHHSFRAMRLNGISKAETTIDDRNHASLAVFTNAVQAVGGTVTKAGDIHCVDGSGTAVDSESLYRIVIN